MQIRNAAKLKILQPKLEKLKEEMEVGPRTPEKVIDFQRKYRALMSANDVSILRGLYVPLGQVMSPEIKLAFTRLRLGLQDPNVFGIFLGITRASKVL